MKKLMTTAFYITLFAVFFSGCVIANFADFNSVSGKGNPEKFDFQVGEFNSIRLEGFANVNYYASASDTVTLEVQPNLLEHFVVEVINDELIVRTTRRISFNTSRTPVLTVSAPVLNRLTFSGAGSFTAHDTITSDSFTLRVSGAGKGKADLDVDNLSVNFSGAGNFELSGSADTADLTMSGAGELAALSLQTREAKIDLSGTGTVSITCTENLQIRASGVGTILYRGSPSIDISRSGVVSIRRVD
jgi:hypothetical protein